MAENENQGGDQAQPIPKISSDKIIMGCIVVALGIGCVLIVIVGLALFSKLQGPNLGPGDGSLTGGQVDCSGVASLTTDQYQWVKDASSKYLKSDEAALIALIQIESSWNPNSTNNGKATGLGQFMPKTARGFPEFVGGDDKHGINWPAGTVYDISTGHPDDARFDPKRAIYATAHLLGGQMNKYGNLGDAYEQGYHSFCTDPTTSCDNQKKEAAAGRARLEKVYNDLTNGGGCKISGTYAGSGTYCGVVNVSTDNMSFNSARSSPKLMPPAADAFNKMAAEYKNTLNKKLQISSMFRTYDQQVSMYKDPSSDHPAKPGTSPHEAGVAFDANLAAICGGCPHSTCLDYETLKKIAVKYGFQPISNKLCTSEDHHFDYEPAYTQFNRDTRKMIQAATSTSCSK
jgi:hypothetical protein